MAYRHLHYIPVCLFVLIPVTFFITYTWAVLLDHVDPGFPYISDTGTLPPESCFFGQMFFFGTVMLGCCVYIRYRQVDEMAADVSKRMNLISAWVGVIAALGFSLVGNFQEFNVYEVHILGAGICFIFGTIYFCLQTWFSYKIKPRVNKNWVLHLRLALSLLCIVFALSTAIPGLLAYIEYEGENKLKWRPEDGGWVLHLVSTGSEWILVTCFCLFFLTLLKDFSIITILPPRIEIEISKTN